MNALKTISFILVILSGLLAGVLLFSLTNGSPEASFPFLLVFTGLLIALLIVVLIMKRKRSG